MLIARRILFKQEERKPKLKKKNKQQINKQRKPFLIEFVPVKDVLFSNWLFQTVSVLNPFNFSEIFEKPFKCARIKNT